MTTYKTWAEFLARDGKTSTVKKEISVYDAIRKSYNPALQQNEITAKRKFPFIETD